MYSDVELCQSAQSVARVAVLAILRPAILAELRHPGRPLGAGVYAAALDARADLARELFREMERSRVALDAVRTRARRETNRRRYVLT